MKINRIKLLFSLGMGIIASSAYLMSQKVSAIFLCIGAAIVFGVFLRMLIGIYEELKK